MMHKWSSTKHPNHQAIRQRNNQRRHRQRVKEHTSDLELELQQTQCQLRDALSRVNELESELENARAGAGTENHAAFDLGGLGSVDGEVSEDAGERDNKVYELLPPPPQGKSTMLCREAYIIIAQQNYKGIDKMEIRRRLERGFHGGLHQGEGCRVDNELLFGLLDFLTSD